MSILDDVFDYLMGGTLPPIRAAIGVMKDGRPEAYAGYVSDVVAGYAATYMGALAVADHSRQHWCDIPHTCPVVTYVRVDGELPGDASDLPPSMTAWQQDLEEERMHEEVRP